MLVGVVGSLFFLGTYQIGLTCQIFKWKLEHRISASEKWVSKHGCVISDLMADIAKVKAGILELREIREILKEYKKSDKSSEKG